MKKIIKINWYLSRYNEQKAVLSLEFGVALSEVAKELNMEMTREIVLRAEKILANEMRLGDAERFACNMHSLVLAALEPKEL